MSLDRDELAARLAAANLSNNGDDVVDPAKWAAYVVRLTDALLAALVPVAPASGAPEGAARLIYVDGRGITVADVTEPFNVGDEVLIRARVRAVEESDATPMKALLLKAGWCHVARPLPGAPLAAPSPAATPAAWVPSVGDVVTVVEEAHRRRHAGCEWLVKEVTGGVDIRFAWLKAGASGAKYGNDDTTNITAVPVAFVRRATSSERAAAGLPVDESAVDRVALAKVLREVENGAAWCEAHPWSSMGDGPAKERYLKSKERYLKSADAAIAFMAKRGAS